MKKDLILNFRVDPETMERLQAISRTSGLSAGRLMSQIATDIAADPGTLFLYELATMQPEFSARKSWIDFQVMAMSKFGGALTESERGTWKGLVDQAKEIFARQLQKAYAEAQAQTTTSREAQPVHV